MKASQFSPEPIITILQQAERGEQSISAVCREHGLAETTFTQRVPGWRTQYGGLTVAEVHRLKQLEQENARRKRLLAARDLEVDTLKQLLANKV